MLKSTFSVSADGGRVLRRLGNGSRNSLTLGLGKPPGELSVRSISGPAARDDRELLVMEGVPEVLPAEVTERQYTPRWVSGEYVLRTAAERVCMVAA